MHAAEIARSIGVIAVDCQAVAATKGLMFSLTVDFAGTHSSEWASDEEMERCSLQSRYALPSLSRFTGWFYLAPTGRS